MYLNRILLTSVSTTTNKITSTLNFSYIAGVQQHLSASKYCDKKFLTNASCTNNKQQQQAVENHTSNNNKCGVATTATATAYSKHDWDRVVSEAEKIVGYPTSFLNLRWLLSDEIANVALQLRKLVGSSHPLLKTAKDGAKQIVYINDNKRHLLYSGKSNMQAWGLIVLLISKAAGHAPSIPEMEQDKSAGVLHSQRTLAEITEMIRIAHLVHQGLVNLQPLINTEVDVSFHNAMTFGNKISILCGDYLLGTSSVELASLRNQKVNELITSALRDLTESEFIGDRDLQNHALPSKPRGGSSSSSSSSSNSINNMEHDSEFDMNEIFAVNDLLKPYPKDDCLGIAEKEWTIRHILNVGSLLGKSCRGALCLAGLPETMQCDGYHFGKHLSLAWQACIDLEPFKNNKLLPIDMKFSLISAPLLFQLQYNPALYEEIRYGKESIDNINYYTIYKEILNGPGIEKTQNLLEKHSTAAMNYLNKFPSNDARTALQNIIFAVKE